MSLVGSHNTAELSEDKLHAWRQNTNQFRIIGCHDSRRVKLALARGQHKGGDYVLNIDRQFGCVL